jgi:hypothetical protein
MKKIIEWASEKFNDIVLGAFCVILIAFILSLAVLSRIKNDYDHVIKQKNEEIIDLKIDILNVEMREHKDSSIIELYKNRDFVDIAREIEEYHNTNK